MAKPTPRSQQSEREVGSKADLLVLRRREAVLGKAAQVVEIPEGPWPQRPCACSGERLAGRAHETRS
eukprot:7611976-Alexandrium_andersonii.AAC.1